MKPVPVLIVGAGPTGLMMACQLSRFNIPFRIIDKNPGPSERSKALALQSRTLEIYDQMGIADVAVKEGHQTLAANLYVKGKKIQRIPLGEIGKDLSPFPFLHIFEQNKNELLLIDYLVKRNIKIEWNTELVNVSQSDSEVTAVVNNNNSQQEIISSWLVGADGGKSISRHLLNIPFRGDTYENIFYVLDTSLSWDLGYEELIIYWSKNTFTAFFPMKGDNKFRLVGILPEKYIDEQNIVFEDISNSVLEDLDLKIKFRDTKWFSVYRLHHRCISNFRSGRCFLAGDAAHIHSPVGGQGMNTGIQDSYNLAWKLALVVKGIADIQILDTYNEERLPFAKRLVSTTDRAFGFVISKNPVLQFIRIHIFPWLAHILMSINYFRRIIYKTVSQISVNYRYSRLCLTVHRSGFKKVKAGDRMPYFCVVSALNKDSISIYDLLKKPAFHILIFCNETNELWHEKVKLLFSNPDLFEFVKIIYSKENIDAFKKLNVRKWLLCIIRPDNYIGYLSDEYTPDQIENYFKMNGIKIK